jgi:hypothetical protein
MISLRKAFCQFLSLDCPLQRDSLSPKSPQRERKKIEGEREKRVRKKRERDRPLSALLQAEPPLSTLYCLFPTASLHVNCLILFLFNVMLPS